ncbi:hypothetical protein M9H77_30008 [Catharanthus roseus]|uniref:Uncharacterized protein n=1 Tax=Catharanthus roseus TaxID=4058 RepID=A0ACB9ZWX4_CATRO|nr:hypothetical protein M9H77_30008 [Catharanthus roseus]
MPRILRYAFSGMLPYPGLPLWYPNPYRASRNSGKTRTSREKSRRPERTEAISGEPELATDPGKIILCKIQTVPIFKAPEARQTVKTISPCSSLPILRSLHYGISRNLKTPPQMTTPPEFRSQSKYCQFHKDTNHDTEQCIELRKEIEQAIRYGQSNGHLEYQNPTLRLALIGFTGQSINSSGIVDLSVSIHHLLTMGLNGRPALNQFKATTSTYSLTMEVLTVAALFAIRGTNSPPVTNESKHEALTAGLRMAQALNVDQLIIRGDSKAVVRQVTGSFETKESHIKKYAALAKSLLKDFKVTWFEKIDRKNNQRADEVSKAIAREKFQGMWLEPLLKKSIDNEILPIEIENNRITPLEQYIAHDILPKDPAGDWVSPEKQVSGQKRNRKLDATWEGPYQDATSI